MDSISSLHPANDPNIDGRSPSSSWEARIQHVKWQFLQATPVDLRSAVAHALEALHDGSRGLRSWLCAIAHSTATLPQSIPRQVIEVYLNHPDAEPLHDCEGCGLAIPVRINPSRWMDAEPESVYLPSCPACGCRTGWYLYIARNIDTGPASDALRRTRPR